MSARAHLAGMEPSVWTSLMAMNAAAQRVREANDRPARVWGRDKEGGGRQITALGTIWGQGYSKAGLERANDGCKQW